MSDPIFYPIGQFFSNLWRFPTNNPNSYYQNVIFNSSTPRWINFDNNLKPYNECPHLNVVINRKAELFSNGRWKVVGVNDEEKEYPNDPVLELLNNPNPLQNCNEFLKQYSIACDIYATELIYALRATKNADPSALYILPNMMMQVIPTGKLYMQTKIQDIITGFQLQGTGHKTFWTVDEVIYNAQNVGTNLIGQSKIPPLNKPISNIIGALQTRNILIHDKGMIGMLSANGGGDGSGVIPLSEPERLKIEQQFRQDTDIYGDRSKVKITTASMTWNPMSYPVRDLMLFEEIEDDFSTIIAAFNLDRDIFPSIKGATYENKAQGEKASYQNAIKPQADDLADCLTHNFKEMFNTRNRKLKLCYDHLPIMKEDELKEAQAEEAEARAELLEVNRLSILLKDGVINHEQYAKLAGVDLDGSKVITQQTPTLQTTQAN